MVQATRRRVQARPRQAPCWPRHSLSNSVPAQVGGGNRRVDRALPIHRFWWMKKASSTLRSCTPRRTGPASRCWTGAWSPSATARPFSTRCRRFVGGSGDSLSRTGQAAPSSLRATPSLIRRCAPPSPGGRRTLQDAGARWLSCRASDAVFPLPPGEGADGG